MKKCSRCGKKFDPEEVSMYLFDGDTTLYDRLRSPLCDECANEAWNDQEEGIFFDTCDKCGKEFDVFEDEFRYNRERTDTGLGFRDLVDILCCDCALDAADHFYDNVEDNDEVYQVNDTNEAISVYDAALIWASHGKDEDYTFGYSEDELENALS